MDIQKNFLLQNFKTLKQHCSIIEKDVIGEYFPDGGFETALDKFFDVEFRDIESFYTLDYPFQGKIVFNEFKFIELVDVIPEFVVSLIKVGMPFIVSLHKYQKSRKSKPVILSLPNLVESSKIVYHSWNLLGDLLKQDDDERQSSITELESKLGQLVRTKPHYDLLGTLQNVYNSIVLMAISEGILDEGFFNLFIHPDQEKREALYSLAGRELSALRTLGSISGADSIDNIIPRIRQDLLQNGFPRLNQPQSNAYIIDPVNEVAQIEESGIRYVQVDGLVLHLPEDQTTDQSPVYLDFMLSDIKIADIKLSHMEAAFLFYLGAERQANESYWLHEPENHRPTLQKIWNSFALPKHFETELKMTTPTKGSTSTWVWDFRNLNRKTLRNQIHRKTRALRLDALDYNLITSIKPKSPSRGGNYKLNNQIKSFEIVKPSN